MQIIFFMSFVVNLQDSGDELFQCVHKRPNKYVPQAKSNLAKIKLLVNGDVLPTWCTKVAPHSPGVVNYN